MRICQLSHVERTYSFLAPLFHALAADGHEVIAACNLEHDGAEARRFLGPGFELDRIRVSRRVTGSAVTTEILALARYLRRGHFDVLHVHSPLASLQARAAAGLARVPVVVYQAHGFYFHEGTRALPRAAMIALERAFGRHLTDYLVTVNDEDFQLARRLGFRPDPNDVVRIPGVGIDTERFRPLDSTPAAVSARRALRHELGADDDDVVVTFVGRLVHDKGVVELAEAFGRLAAARPARLWLVGDVMASERDHATVGRVRSMLTGPAARRATLLGRRPDVPDLLRASDLFVLPSYREGLPVGLMEAMACGVPVITTDVRGCREAVGHGTAGVVVPARDPARLAEAMCRLAADPTMRQRLGRAARSHVEAHFTVADSIAPQMQLYRRIESTRGAHRDARHDRVDAIARRAATLRRVARATLPVQLRARLVRQPHWMIGVCETDDPLAPTRASPPRPVLTAEQLDGLGLAFVADPFAVRRDGRWFVFFEAVHRGARRGEIALATSDDLHTWTYEGVVLSEPFHLSFPQLLERDGAVLMVPETAEDQSVRLYRATAFPFGWELDQVLLRGLAFKDSTVVHRDGHHYLLTETSAGFTNDELRLFTAADLRGPWVEHPCSPLVAADPDAARPAGAPIIVNQHLVRLSQCCARRYGSAVRAHEITELSPSGYRELALPGTVVAGSGRDWHAGAMHHVDAHPVDGRWVVFVDGHD